MRIVAIRAPARHGNLTVLAVFLSGMAFEAEFFRGPRQKTFVGGCVRLVTIPALALHYRRMDDLPFEWIMTEKTEIRRGFNQLACGAGKVHIMADRTFFIFDRFVHYRFRKKTLVTVLSMGLRTEGEESEKNN